MKKWLRRQMQKMTSPELDWVQVEVSTYCNAACRYCPHTALRDHWVNRHMALAQFKRVLPFLSRTGLVFLQGWGEPLLNPALLEMVRLSKDQGNRTGFTTNGLLLDEGTMHDLLDLELDVLGVSIAGTRTETHNRIRQGTDLDGIKRRLERLRQLKRRRGQTRPEVHLAYLVLRSNFDELREIVPLARQLGATDVVASNLSLIVSPDLSDDVLFQDHPRLDSHTRVLEEIQAQAAAEGLRFAYNGPGLNESSPCCGENVSRACVIGVGGEVIPCVMTDPVLAGPPSDMGQGGPTYAFEGRRYPFEPMVFGNIETASLTDIWKTPRYQRFRRVMDAGGRGAARVPLENLSAACVNCYKRLLEN